MPDLEPTIKITLRGVLVLFIRDGEEICKVGFLNDPPEGHVLTIDFTQQTANGTGLFVRQLTAADVKPDLRLEITNPSQPGVHLYTKRGFDRRNLAGDLKDFRWVLDFNDLYGGPVDIKSAGFLSMLTINNGKFFTEQVSIDDLHLEGESGEDVVIGRVAVGIGANIYLDHPDSTAVFMNGDEKVMEFFPEPGVAYGINISQSPPPSVIEKPEGADANSYSTVILPAPILGRPPITFIAPANPILPSSALPISPNAVCFTGSVRGGGG